MSKTQFTGAISFVLQLPSNWKKVRDIVWEKNAQVPNGAIQIKVTNKPNLIVILCPKGAKEYTLESPLLDFRTDLHEFAVILSWQESNAKLYINGTECATTDTSFKRLESLPINTKDMGKEIDTSSFAQKSAEMQNLRRINAQNLTTK